MNLANRQARARRRAKSNRLARNQNVPQHASKWTARSGWHGPLSVSGHFMTVRQQQRYRKVSRWRYGVPA